MDNLYFKDLESALREGYVFSITTVQIKTQNTRIALISKGDKDEIIEFDPSSDKNNIWFILNEILNKLNKDRVKPDGVTDTQDLLKVSEQVTFKNLEQLIDKGCLLFISTSSLPRVISTIAYAWTNRYIKPFHSIIRNTVDEALIYLDFAFKEFDTNGKPLFQGYEETLKAVEEHKYYDGITEKREQESLKVKELLRSFFIDDRKGN